MPAHLACKAVSHMLIDNNCLLVNCCDWPNRFIGMTNDRREGGNGQGKKNHVIECLEWAGKEEPYLFQAGYKKLFEPGHDPTGKFDTVGKQWIDGYSAILLYTAGNAHLAISIGLGLERLGYHIHDAFIEADKWVMPVMKPMYDAESGQAPALVFGQLPPAPEKKTRRRK